MGCPKAGILSGSTRKSKKVFIDFGSAVFSFAKKCMFLKKDGFIGMIFCPGM